MYLSFVNIPICIVFLWTMCVKHSRVVQVILSDPRGTDPYMTDVLQAILDCICLSALWYIILLQKMIIHNFIYFFQFNVISFTSLGNVLVFRCFVSSSFCLWFNSFTDNLALQTSTLPASSKNIVTIFDFHHCLIVSPILWDLRYIQFQYLSFFSNLKQFFTRIFFKVILHSDSFDFPIFLITLTSFQNAKKKVFP